ncbi:MAG TPA: hypothetical protein VLM41_10395, partial [Steroidobacteraceae bacterium]|nr:hypothetical protein [Steroidobacteraceae bacterium]
MKRGVLLAGALLGLAVLAWNARPPAPETEARRQETAAQSPLQPPAPEKAAAARDTRPEAVAMQLVEPGTAPGIPDQSPAAAREAPLAVRFEQATDFLPLFLELQARAAGGDAESAFYLFRIHEACHHRREKDPRSAAEALADFDRRYLDPRRDAAGNAPADDWIILQRRAEVERAWRACPPELLRRLDSIDAGKLLAQAADLGHPLAQAMTATRMLRAGGEESREQALNYQRAAALSRDPDILYEIARGVGLGAGADDVIRRANAWRLLACRHGLDCGPDSPLIRQSVCQNPSSARCIPGADLEHYLHTWDPEGYQQSYALADQMMQAMNDGRW